MNTHCHRGTICYWQRLGFTAEASPGEEEVVNRRQLPVKPHVDVYHRYTLKAVKFVEVRHRLPFVGNHELQDVNRHG